ncbi:response regulator [uncultured Chitinophaga sp.]|uniref:response regulator n=1 Tax=uncultured Chitinophaga sp. TaxID=339340 RepID=UPI0025E7A101|nr:response regulator [uncultured Chitinophaga sp.]
MAQHFTCLLIDDDTDDQEIFILALKQIDDNIGCQVFDNGRTAIETLKQAPELPNYIFLDLNMPLMDGRQCLQAIRQISRLDDVPVIIYSTSSDPKDKQETLKLGAGHYIEKQASLPQLVKKLEYFF